MEYFAAAFVAANLRHAFDDTNSATERKSRLQPKKLSPTNYHRNGRVEDPLRLLESDLYLTLMCEWLTSRLEIRKK
jgi:hypothetical protein